MPARYRPVTTKKVPATFGPFRNGKEKRLNRIIVARYFRAKKGN